MDEYLFFQANKKQLQENKSIITPNIFKTATKDENCNYEFNSTCSSRLSKAGRMILNSANTKKRDDQQFPAIRAPKKTLVEIDQNSIEQSTKCNNELSCDTMHNCLKMLSTNYKEQYASSGFPPKICTLMLKELSKCTVNQLKLKILDIGCGKGYLGEYLKQDGFCNITGIDCSKNLLQVAETKKAYQKLEKVAVGETEIGEQHNGKYDFVISSSMINNDGWDESVFHEMLKQVKMGGIVIFATKLNLNQDNQYGAEMNKLDQQMYWKFITEHVFYRYDKISDNTGKFSNKKVKIVAYQKTDHNVWVEQERIRFEQEEKIRVEKQRIIDERNEKKEAKLNVAQIRQAERKKLQEQKSQEMVAEEQKAAEEAKIAEKEATRQAQELEKEKQRLMQEMQAKMKEAMWKQLKEAQAAEVAKRESKRQEILRQKTLNGPKKERPGFNAGA